MLILGQIVAYFLQVVRSKLAQRRQRTIDDLKSRLLLNRDMFLEILFLQFDLSRLNLTPNDLLDLVIHIKVRSGFINIMLMLILILMFKEQMGISRVKYIFLRLTLIIMECLFAV